VLPVFIRALGKTFQPSLASLSASALGVITTANRSAVALSQSVTTLFADPFAGLKGRDLHDGVTYTEKKFSGQYFVCFIFRKMILFIHCDWKIIYCRWKSADLLSEFKRKHETKNIWQNILDQRCQRLANSKLDRVGSCIVRVRIARPKEAFQPIFAATRHHVHVKMRHTLANAIVHRHKRPVGFHCGFDSAREELGPSEKRSNQIFGQIGQGFVVDFRNQQAMPRKNRPMIEKDERDFVFEYQARRHFPGGYLTKQTRGSG
jgi:hypothetical protein